MKIGKLVTGRDVYIENEEYLISLLISIPETERNFDIGNFDVTVRFTDDNVIKGMGIIKYTNPTMRTLWTLLTFPLRVINLIEDSQSVRINLYTSVDNAEEIRNLLIEIEPVELQVYSVKILLEVQLFGLRYLMHYFFVTGWILGTIILVVFQIVALISFLVYKYLQVRYQKTPSDNCPIVPVSDLQWIEPDPTYEPREVDFSKILKPKLSKWELLMAKLSITKHKLS